LSDFPFVPPVGREASAVPPVGRVASAVPPVGREASAVPPVRRDFISFGEILLRLSAPGFERVLQSNQLNVCVGGAEANVAAALSQWGHRSAMISVLPNNPLAESAMGELRRFGVDCAPVSRGDGRMGLYFYEQGALSRPSEVIYDRAYSAFSALEADRFDWPELLWGSQRLHLSGVTPALGAQPAQAAIAAARCAREMGMRVSFDGNFRSKLWQSWNGDAPALLKELMLQADVIFANHRDIALVLKQDIESTDPRLAFAEAARIAFTAFPNLEHFAATIRLSESMDQQSLSALLALRSGQIIETSASPLNGAIERVGTGDAFAAGLLHGLHTNMPLDRSLSFALAAGCIKHTIPGDLMRASEAEIEAYCSGHGPHIRR
jgi:2-dehydro-3-deoxygluconokinase